MKRKYSRREFVRKNSTTGLGVLLVAGITPSAFADNVRMADTPAILGGQKVRTKGWPGWPRWIPETDEKQVLDVLRSGVWSRSKVVDEFERKWAETLGARRCLTVVNGTNALICAIRNLDIGAGDEVIVPPYTFIATIQAVLQNGAMPVFADIDPENGLIDPERIKEKITPRTKAIVPVHILGLPADIVNIIDIAKRNNLFVVEDTCNAWLAEVNHKKAGTFGNAGCFSFQNSKHLPMGEGGAIVSDDDKFMDRCYSYHNFGSTYGSVVHPASMKNVSVMEGTKLRLTEYQAAIGLVQLKRLDEETTIRSKNAEYLRSKMKSIPGILPFKIYDNVTRAVFHSFPFRYRKEEFSNLSLDEFIKALSAEGIPCSRGWGAWLNNGLYIKHAFQTKNYRKMYPAEMLDFERFVKQNRCPKNDILCNEEAVLLSHSILLGTRSDMDDILNAIEKIHKNADKLKK